MTEGAREDAGRRAGRGRLNSIELLPEEAEPDIVWAVGELRERSMPQQAILAELNARLADRGIGPISKSAFSRHWLKLAAIGRRIEETRAIAAVLAERLKPGDADDLTVLVAETIKTLVFELLQAGGEAGFTPKGAMELAQALKAAAAAQKVSSDRRVKVEKELAEKVDQVVVKVAEASGLSAERLAQIRRDVLGVRS